MAAGPCSQDSETHSGIWPEPALHPGGSSRAATSPLCPQIGQIQDRVSALSGCSDKGIAPWGGKIQPEIPSTGWPDRIFSLQDFEIPARSGCQWGPYASILRGLEEQGAPEALLL